MTKNMGTADRAIRIVAAVVVAVLYLTGTITGMLALVLGVIGVVFIVTSLVGFCPAYVPLGISTRRRGAGSAHV